MWFVEAGFDFGRLPPEPPTPPEIPFFDNVEKWLIGLWLMAAVFLACFLYHNWLVVVLLFCLV